MLNYVINEKTLAIIPYGMKKSLVLEETGKYIVNKNPNNIIRNNCILYGSTYEEKLRRTEILTGYNYKAPILINLDKRLIFFPSSSPRLRDCAWINPLKIRNYKFDTDKSMSNIEFLNGEDVFISASIKIVENQILRSSKLLSLSVLKPSYF